MSLLVVVQARMNSIRFQNKIAAELGGSTMLAQVVHRANMLGPLVVAFPPPDLKESDVLGRFARIAQKNPDVDTLVRITADCPLLDPGVGGYLINLYRQGGYDFVGTSPECDGLDTEVFSRTALMIADLNARGSAREHLTQYMRRNLGAKIINVAPEPLRWSVDDQSGLDFVRAVYEACVHCRQAVPMHSNAGSSIGGADRTICYDLHQVADGGLAECQAADLKRNRMGGAVYISTGEE